MWNTDPPKQIQANAPTGGIENSGKGVPYVHASCSKVLIAVLSSTYFAQRGLFFVSMLSCLVHPYDLSSFASNVVGRGSFADPKMNEIFNTTDAAPSLSHQSASFGVYERFLPVGAVAWIGSDIYFTGETYFENNSARSRGGKKD